MLLMQIFLNVNYIFAGLDQNIYKKCQELHAYVLT